MYRSSLAAHPPRILGVDIRELSIKRYERVVADTLLVSINKQKFSCPQGTQGKRIRIVKNHLGEFVGEMIDGYSKEPFVLIPSQGFVELDDFEHRAHHTYRQKIETEVERDKREKREEKRQKKNEKRLFLEPKEKTVEPDTVFSQARADKAYCFPSAFQAQAYIGKHLPEGQTYKDYADIFDELLVLDLKRESIDLVLKAINRQVMAQ